MTLKSFKSQAFTDQIKDKATKNAIVEIQEYLTALKDQFDVPDTQRQSVTRDTSNITVYNLTHDAFVKTMPLASGVGVGDIVAFYGSTAVKASLNAYSTIPRGVVHSYLSGGIYNIMLTGLCKIKIADTTAKSRNSTLWMSQTDGQATCTLPLTGTYEMEIGWLEEDTTGAGLYLCYFKPPTIARYVL